MGRRRQRLRDSRKEPSADRAPGGTAPYPHAAMAHSRRRAISTLVFAGAMASVMGSAHALSLGEIAVESALGEPLRARVPIELSAGETLGPECVAAAARESAGLIRLPNPRFMLPHGTRAGRYDLQISTTKPLYEPMYELRLQLRCTGNVMLVRQFVLMLDLPGSQATLPPAPAPVSMGPPQPTARLPAPQDRPAAAAPLNRPLVRAAAGGPPAPLTTGTAYRVQAGDTLSTIAARVRDRAGLSIWQLADHIFTSNPQAFIGGNPDRIRLGAEILLPRPLHAPGASSPAEAAPGMATAAANPAETQLPVPPSAWPEHSMAIDPVMFEPAESAIVVAVAPPVLPIEDFQAEVVSPPAQTPVTGTRQGTAPWLAALTGLLIGLLASAALLRERLLDALRELRLPRRASIRARAAPATPPANVRPAPVTQTRATPAMLVEESRYEPEAQRHRETTVPEQRPAPTDVIEPVGATADAGGHYEFAGLLDPALDVPQLESSLEGSLEIDDSGAVLAVDQASGATEATVETEPQLDSDIAWLGDGEETSLSPASEAETGRLPAGDRKERTDLHGLARQLVDDDSIAETLKEALELLESDYEQEHTASQIVDRSQFDDIAAELPGEDDTLIRTGTDRIPRR